MKVERWFKSEAFYSHGESNSCRVLICFMASKKLYIRNKLSGNDGRILILDVDIDDENVIFISLHNSNTEAGQLKTLSKLTEMLTKLHLTQSNNIVCAKGFNLFLTLNLRVRRKSNFWKVLCRKNIWTERNIQFGGNLENKKS